MHTAYSIQHTHDERQTLASDATTRLEKVQSACERHAEMLRRTRVKGEPAAIQDDAADAEAKRYRPLTRNCHCGKRGSFNYAKLDGRSAHGDSKHFGAPPFQRAEYVMHELNAVAARHNDNDNHDLDNLLNRLELNRQTGKPGKQKPKPTGVCGYVFAACAKLISSSLRHSDNKRSKCCL